MADMAPGFRDTPGDGPGLGRLSSDRDQESTPRKLIFPYQWTSLQSSEATLEAGRTLPLHALVFSEKQSQPIGQINLHGLELQAAP
jgi:hypothetical protein